MEPQEFLRLDSGPGEFVMETFKHSVSIYVFRILQLTQTNAHHAIWCYTDCRLRLDHDEYNVSDKMTIKQQVVKTYIGKFSYRSESPYWSKISQKKLHSTKQNIPISRRTGLLTARQPSHICSMYDNARWGRGGRGRVRPQGCI